MISPWAQPNYVDRNLTNQASVINFIEDNWRLGSVDGSDPPPNGQASFDRNAGTLRHLFSFETRPSKETVLLDCDGTYVQKQKRGAPLTLSLRGARARGPRRPLPRAPSELS